MQVEFTYKEASFSRQHRDTSCIDIWGSFVQQIKKLHKFRWSMKKLHSANKIRMQVELTYKEASCSRQHKDTIWNDIWRNFIQQAKWGHKLSWHMRMFNSSDKIRMYVELTYAEASFGRQHKDKSWVDRWRRFF